ncbi:MAG: polymer-forming cytoskeletal protein [Pyrinomonadaceae bacterium]|nr:polymer-forming cytoskeletal protein [Blastocatellia bacterium]MCW5956113.1 polymer-forming cytoskeletal protein [Pyrinomonadaceae bacterium]
MGRNSKSETSDAPEFQSSYPQTQSSPSALYGSETPNTVSRPATDSENIARDIKDGKLSGFVGHGTSLTGDTSFQMMLRVDGHLTGTVTSDGGTLIVGNNGQLDANVSVGVAQINGTINGDVAATERIQLGRTARVVGNIATPKLVIEDGAIFEGGCTMLKAREAQEKEAASASSTSSYSSSSTSSPSYSSSSSYSSTSASTASVADDDDDDAEDEKSETATV